MFRVKSETVVSRNGRITDAVARNDKDQSFSRPSENTLNPLVARRGIARTGI